jgi:hypothetical protein
MRFFITTNANRPAKAGGRSFTFEPVALRGGTWLGVLAVEDALAASILADRPSGVDEISAERYEGLKKKQTADLNNSRLPQAQSSPGVTVAEPAVNVTSRTTVESKPVEVASVELQTTSSQPPVEPLLAQPVKRGKAW